MHLMDYDKKQAIIARVEARLGSNVVINSTYANAADRAKEYQAKLFSDLNAKLEALSSTLQEAA